MLRGQPQAEAVVSEAQVLVVGDAGAWAAAAAVAVGDSTRAFQASRGQEIQEHLQDLESQTAVSWAAVGEVVAAEGAYRIHSLGLAEGGVGAHELAWSGRPVQQQYEVRGYHTLKGGGCSFVRNGSAPEENQKKILTIKSSLPSSTAIEDLYRNFTFLLHLPAQKDHSLNSFEDLLFHYRSKRYTWVHEDGIEAESALLKCFFNPPDEMS